MRVGIGLPAAVPEAEMAVLGRWAAEAEGAGFSSVGVIDRLVYENLDPLVALGAAAVTTGRVELLTTVLNVCWRGNAVLLAKQISSVDRLSAGRLTLGLGLGGWPVDYEASGLPMTGLGGRMETMLATMWRTWEPASHQPRIMLGGLAPASFARAAKPPSLGWVAPLFGLSVLKDGIAAVRRACSEAGREDRPRIVTGRYFSLGKDAQGVADQYIRHYYGPEYFDLARADTLTDADQIQAELLRLSKAGCTDVLFFPCTGGLEQIGLLAESLQAAAPVSEGI
jgi:alkanesulfonate monooxygenase SsuD/methylene tetrahydromethanopterin reductase-like flavin-dependent oxidoreductase (luciferase family)